MDASVSIQKEEPCLEFVCLVKPPFNLHNLSHSVQGNDFSPCISVNTSLNSHSISSLSVSVTTMERFNWYISGVATVDKSISVEEDPSSATS